MSSLYRSPFQSNRTPLLLLLRIGLCVVYVIKHVGCGLSDAHTQYEYVKVEAQYESQHWRRADGRRR